MFSRFSCPFPVWFNCFNFLGLPPLLCFPVRQSFLVIPSFMFLLSTFPSDKGNFRSDFLMAKFQLFINRWWSAISRETHIVWSMPTKEELTASPWREKHSILQYIIKSLLLQGCYNKPAGILEWTRELICCVYHLSYFVYWHKVWLYPCLYLNFKCLPVGCPPKSLWKDLGDLLKLKLNIKNLFTYTYSINLFFMNR